jgi:small GTP-binding protein
VAGEQINLTLGTAGHVDHGKTALIKCLTGCETDRLREEKERGLSIELGFAPCTLGEVEVGIVDVPGHEHFVKTMVAGATGIDAVLFVVAADDGIMPQTREHLDILTLLGVEAGLVALTKIDRVPDQRVDAVRSDLERFLAGTFLEGAPILAVSSVTGAGFDAFLARTAALWPRRQSNSSAGLDVRAGRFGGSGSERSRTARRSAAPRGIRLPRSPRRLESILLRRAGRGVSGAPKRKESHGTRKRRHDRWTL